jgi:dienelactone hydrolase
MKAIQTMLGAAVLWMCGAAVGAIVSEDVEYAAGDVTLKGYLVYDDALTETRPGVLVVHEWWGLNDYARRRARMLAELGYTALAVDMYGQGQNTEHPQQAREFASAVRNNMPAARDRLKAGMETLKKHKTVNPDKIAAIGYCFGGGIVLQMALDGVALDGVVSFHGSLSGVYPDDEPRVKAGILICHGADDPHISAEQIDQFRRELEKADANWQMNIYSGTVHSFTNPDAGDDPSTGSAYNKQADRRSWDAMKRFLEEIFDGPENDPAA